MTIYDYITALGGLALFLYGMHMLSASLEKVSGNKLSKILEKLTGNPIKSILLGAIITALVQSSGATTVISVGLVNSGILKLSQAIGIIMGSNIGTTVTGHILRLTDISGGSFLLNLVKPSTFAPIVAFIGAALVMFGKKSKTKCAGEIMAAMGILFIGMLSMESSLSGLKDSPVLASAFSKIGDNILLGIIIGAAVTALLQSSSASVGILQALSSTGAITWAAAVPIILGQNIGSTVTSLISVIGSSKNAKRTALSHLYFNIIGTVLFTIGIFVIKYSNLLSFWDNPIDKAGIANFHTIFNVSMTLLLMPFIKQLEKLCMISIPDSGDETDFDTSRLDDRLLEAPSIAIAESRVIVEKIVETSRKCLKEAFMRLYHPESIPDAKVQEKYLAVSKMCDSLHEYLIKINAQGLGEDETKRVLYFLSVSDDFLHVADHAKYISMTAEDVTERGKNITEKGKEELGILSDAAYELVDLSAKGILERNYDMYLEIEPLKKVIGQMTDVIRSRHIERLRNGECSYTASTHFIATLIDIERIAKHCANVSVSLAMPKKPPEMPEHEFAKKIHAGFDKKQYSGNLKKYETKYYQNLLTE